MKILILLSILLAACGKPGSNGNNSGSAATPCASQYAGAWHGSLNFNLNADCSGTSGADRFTWTVPTSGTTQLTFANGSVSTCMAWLNADASGLYLNCGSGTLFYTR